MKLLRKTLPALLAAGAALLVIPGMTGCYATGEAFIIDDTPPPPRAEVVVARPGFIWIPGRWILSANAWVWQGGYYERQRPNAVYVAGRWERRGRGYVWIGGGWRARGGVVIRDRR